MSYPSDQDLANFPYVFMMADTDWDPSIFDNHHDSPIHNEEKVIFNSEFLNSSKIKKLEFLKVLGNLGTWIWVIFINLMTPIYSVALDMLI